MSREENDDIKMGKNLDSDQPSFDLKFQHGILNLALREDHFCSQLTRYLGSDKDLAEFQIFDNVPTEKIFTLICSSMEKFKTRPSEGELRQLFTEEPETDRNKLNHTLDQILSMQVHNDSFYRKYIGAFVQKCKLAKGMVKIQKSWKKDAGKSAPDVMQDVIDSVRRVDFEQQNKVSMNSFDSLYNERKTGQGSKIPTGITALDEDLLGGLPRESLVVVLSGTNVGKSIFSISLACQALKARDLSGKNRNFKILHVNLEGRHDEALFRYVANYAQVNLKAIATGKMTPAESERVEAAKVEIGDRLQIINMTTFGVTIEDLIAYTREFYKEFKFDMLVVDYGQLLETRRKAESHRLAQATVFRGLDSMSKEFKAVVVSPVQATRGAQENQNFNSFKNRGKADGDPMPVMRSNDISEAFEIARVSAVILSLNRTDQEVEQGKLRVFLEKQREGAKNKTYGVYTNYPMSDVITGRYYDPKATLMKENEAVDKKDTVSISDYDPEVNDSEVVETKKEEIDLLVEEFKDLSAKENSKRLDFNQESKKENKNNDIIEQYVQDLEKIKKKKVEIAKKAQESIKLVDPNASEALLKEMEKSLKDLHKSGASEAQINAQEKIINRYRLALKGKI